MHEVIISGTGYNILVDFNPSTADKIYRMDFVYLDPYRKPVSFDSQMCKMEDIDIHNINIGDIGEYNPGENYFSVAWRKAFPYREHNIELATLLGMERNNKARVFGNKIGEQTIALGDADIGLQRGDDLLIQINDHKQYKIMRNINQELLKYNLQQQMAKKL